jgi:hypothetical protein
MGADRERQKDEDTAFELPERYFSKEKSGFKPAAKSPADDRDTRRTPVDAKDVPRKALAGPGRRGA